MWSVRARKLIVNSYKSLYLFTGFSFSKKKFEEKSILFGAFFVAKNLFQDPTTHKTNIGNWFVAQFSNQTDSLKSRF